MSMPDLSPITSQSTRPKKGRDRLQSGLEDVLYALVGDGVGLKMATFLLRLNDQGVVERGQVEVSRGRCAL